MTTSGCHPNCRMRRAIAAALVGTLLTGACSSGAQRSKPPSSSTAATTATTPGSGTSPTISTPSTSIPGGPAKTGASGVRLSAGHSLAAAARPVPLVKGTPLDDSAVAQVESRLPQWSGDDTLAKPFNWPIEAKPPPRAGATVAVTFPAAQQVPPVVVASGPLHVLRSQPQGAVSIAPFISITFDQPMVPVATVGQLAGAAAPATISPAIPGRWQWIGTSTARFDATSDLVDRLPMATSYTVQVPAGTKSATGGVLADAVSFQFATPPVTVQSFRPTGESLSLTPVFLATFDQRVDAQAVLATIVVRAGDERRPVRLATAEEIAADDSGQSVIASVPDARWIAFRPVDPFPADTAISVAIGPGTPSAEGPVVATVAATYSGRTYAPLRVTTVDCGYGENCPPPSDIDITFNNALDTARFDPATIRIDPLIPGAVVSAFGNVIAIHGATLARTNYRVTVPAGLTDVYGQRFAADDTHTVAIGSAAPVLQQFAQPLTTLDPLVAHPSLSVVTVNHADFRLRVFKVSPPDWPGYLQYVMQLLQGGPSDQAPPVPPWPVVLDKEVTVAGNPDRAVETPVDLSAALGGPHGHLVVQIDPTETYEPNGNDYWANRPTVTWAQATAIGLDAFVDRTQLRAWATKLGDGAPLKGVVVQSIGVAGTAPTDEDGLATLVLGAQGSTALVGTSGDDTAILPAGYYGESWQRSPVPDDARWYVFDDRQIYRPGETVSMKGWIRRLTSSSDAQLQLFGAGVKVSYSARDGQGTVIASGDAKVDPLGGFDFTFPVPPDATLGYSSVELTIGGVAGLLSSGTYTQPFQIEEFRRPEFEVAARTESAGPYIQGAPVTVAVDANYYAGGPLGAAPVGWKVTTAAASYSPPGWDGFDFGLWTPWWYGDSNNSRAGVDVPAASSVPCCVAPPGTPDAKVAEFSGATDAAGSNYLQIDVANPDTDRAGLPVAVTAEATVTDVNRQAWASTTSVLVHPADLYVGLRGANTFVNRGSPLAIDAIVTDVDGKVVSGNKLRVTASRQESVFKNGQWTISPADPQNCDVVSTAVPVTCTFTTTVGGTYTISSSVVDEQGRSSRTELTRWVSGADTPPARTVDRQALTIVPDKAEYEPGDTAKLLVQSPFATGDGLLTVTRNGIISASRFEVADFSAVVKIPITDRQIPSLGVSIEVVGATPRTADDAGALPGSPPRPAYATGGLTPAISSKVRSLTVTAVPKAATVEPGAKTQVAVTVTDHGGKPVAGSQLAVVVVDEAVLALSNYKLQDPLAAFYSQLPDYLSSQYGRQTIVLANPLTLASGPGAETAGTAAASATTTAAAAGGRSSGQPAGGAVPAPMASDSSAAGSPGAAGTPIGVRTNFDALAVFEPSVVTDASGHAEIDVPLPDNLTRYRVMVVAVAGAEQFGSTEANITARLPLMVRPSAPRFLNFGDTFKLPVVLQNQTDAAMNVDVVLQTANLDVSGGAGQQVTVPANDRVELRFPVSAAQAGTARFRVAAVSGDAADAATVELPVYTPATSEAFATYGVLDDGATLQPLVAPAGVIPQFGGLDITTSSTSLQALTDAVLYLSQYPYQSSDAMASEILAISSLRDVLQAFNAPGLPSAKDLNASVTSDIGSLVALQGDDGGFPYWEHGKASDPFNSIEATHALVVARTGGFAVPQATIDRAIGYLSDIESHIPAYYGQDARDSLSAYALNVRNLAGNADPAKAKALFTSRGKDLPLDALAWLWPVIQDKATSAAIETIIQNRAVDTAGAVTFTTAASDGAYLTLQSDRRTDGLILDALIAQLPKSDLIPKVVTGLLAAQSQGRWDNIQENSFILLALKGYFDTYEKQTPDFVAGVWLGDRFAGEQPFVGRSTDRLQIGIPTADLLTAGAIGVTISKAGTGRLYYRIGLRTAPTDLRLQPLDRGFVVARTYEAVDNPADVTRADDGTWHITAGAKVRVRLTMVAESQRTHVALTDPLPAGLEILNPALATTPDVPVDPVPSANGNGKGDAVVLPPWYRTWFDHQDSRDDRAEAFAGVLPAGAYDYSYVARATTPGSFVVPPTHAEEMYAPETFGRAATDTVVIA